MLQLDTNASTFKDKTVSLSFRGFYKILEQNKDVSESLLIVSFTPGQTKDRLVEKTLLEVGSFSNCVHIDSLLTRAVQQLKKRKALSENQTLGTLRTSDNMFLELGSQKCDGNSTLCWRACDMCHLRTGSVLKSSAGLLSPSPLPLMADIFTW